MDSHCILEQNDLLKSISLNKFAIEACETKESTQILLIGGNGSVYNSLDLGLLGFNSFAGNDVPQVLQLSLGEQTFGAFEVELPLQQGLENYFQLMKV